MSRILVGVDDTPAALHAARLAVDLASTTHARMRFVHVLADGELARHFTRLQPNGTLRERRASASASLLAHVAALAR